MNIFLIGGTTVDRKDQKFAAEKKKLQRLMVPIGRQLIERGDNLLVCSPMDDSADLPAVNGAAQALRKTSSNITRIEYHHPDASDVVVAWQEVCKTLACAAAMKPSLYPTPRNEAGKEQLQYAYLIAQIAALDKSNAVLAIGGKLGRTASMLLSVAIEKKKPVLPLPHMGGAAGSCYDILRPQLSNYLGDQLSDLLNQKKTDAVLPLLQQLADGQLAPGELGQNPRFFISYPRERPQEADYVEAVLRRYNHAPFRDEHDFLPAAKLPLEIKNAIHGCTVFIALWCRQYACSPWCFDEMDIALKLMDAGRLTIWIFNVDDTRMVPPQARDLKTLAGKTRNEIEGELTRLVLGPMALKRSD